MSSHLESVVYKTWSQKILNTLLLPAQQQGFNEYLILLIGRRGTGKTTLCQALKQRLEKKDEKVEYLTPARLANILSKEKSLEEYIEHIRQGSSITVIFDDIVEFLNQLKKEEAVKVLSEIFNLLKKSASLEDENKTERIRILLVIQKHYLEDFLNYIGGLRETDPSFTEIWHRTLIVGDLDEILNNMFSRVQEVSSVDDSLLYMHHTRRSVIIDLDLLWNKVRHDDNTLVENIKVVLDEIGLPLRETDKQKIVELIKVYLRTLPVKYIRLKPRAYREIRVLEESLTGECLSDAVRKFVQVRSSVYTRLYEELEKLHDLLSLPSRTIIDAFDLYLKHRSRYVPVIDARAKFEEDDRKVGVTLDLAIFERENSPILIIHVARPKKQYSGDTRRRYTYTRKRTRKIIKLAAQFQSKLVILTETSDIIDKLYADIGRLGLDKSMYRVIDLNEFSIEEKKWIALSSIVKSHRADITSIWINGFENILNRLGILEFLKQSNILTESEV